MSDQQEWIRIRGARTHNLQNLDVDLPRDCLTVFTGPSGSGKSSLAFDTIHAEGQRRYLETLRCDTRALFTQLQRPDVDLVDGLPPTLCVAQQAATAQRRSTLATITEIHDHLRLLWARLGTPHCVQCDQPVIKHTIREIVRQTLATQEGHKVYLLAPLLRSQPGQHRDVLQSIRQAGFLRARIDDVLQEIRELPQLDAKQKHTIEMVVDRLVIRPGIDERLAESLATAVKHGKGHVVITDIDDGDWHDHFFSTKLSCPQCGTVLPDLEPRLFSFNNPYGACLTCTGLGSWRAEHGEVPDSAQHSKSGTSRCSTRLDDDEETDPPLEYLACPDCGGARLRQEIRAVRFEGKGLHEVTAMTVDDAARFFAAQQKGLNPPARGTDLRFVLVQEISHRLVFLQEVGLGYLTLDRPAPTLSGGEIQRARLATHLGGHLLGVCYILDEPTIGLHPRDTERLITALRGLQRRGNTVLIVEHDEEVMRQADYLVDIGPGAGRLGGRLLAHGSLEEVLSNPASVTAPFLIRRAEHRKVPDSANHPAPYGARLAESRLTIRGARHHNLKNIDVSIPLGQLVCITGVSGSGKSSLARDILCHAARRKLGLLAPTPGAHDAIEGLEHLDKVIEVDQAPLGRSTRSSPATYTGVYDEIRKVFATTRTAKLRGYKANRFSFNVKGGRCEECQGQGSLRVALQFLPDLSVPCSACRGKRFNRATLEVLYRGQSIADVLDMPVAGALDFFANIGAVSRPLQALTDVGLGYVPLGQPSRTLSGGEAQRVKLAAELARTATGRTLFLLDEPTTGLHFADVATLVSVLRRLVSAGNTVIVIEHHLDLIAASDWVIDLGPEAGDAGGYLLAAGTPEEVMACEKSVTGRFLCKRTNSLCVDEE